MDRQRRRDREPSNLHDVPFPDPRRHAAARLWRSHLFPGLCLQRRLLEHAAESQQLSLGALDAPQRVFSSFLGYDPHQHTNLPNCVHGNDDERANQPRPVQALRGAQRKVAVRSWSVGQHRRLPRRLLLRLAQSEKE